jgi:hypothetical protein
MFPQILPSQNLFPNISAVFPATSFVFTHVSSLSVRRSKLGLKIGFFGGREDSESAEQRRHSPHLMS